MLQVLLLAMVGLGGLAFIGGDSDGDSEDVDVDDAEEDEDEVVVDIEPLLDLEQPAADVIGTDDDDELVLNSKDQEGRITALGGEGADKFIVLPFDTFEQGEDVVAEIFDFDPSEDKLVIQALYTQKHSFDVEEHVENVELERDEENGTTTVYLEMNEWDGEDNPITKKILVHSEAPFSQMDIEFVINPEHHNSFQNLELVPLTFLENDEAPGRMVLPGIPSYFVGDDDDEISVVTTSHTVLTGGGDDNVELDTPDEGLTTHIFTEEGDDTITANGSNMNLWAGAGDDYVHTVDATDSVTIQGGEGISIPFPQRELHVNYLPSRDDS